jgi:hypothetical protein
MALSVSTIEAAITAVTTGGQSYVIGDREFRRGDLEVLRQMRLDAIAAERNTAKTIFQRVRFGKVGS